MRKPSHLKKSSKNLSLKEKPLERLSTSKTER